MEGIRKVLEHLWADQGLGLAELEQHKDWTISESGSEGGIGIEAAERWLKTLSDKELEDFCIGDQDKDIQPMMEAAEDKEGAEAAHLVLETIFMTIEHVTR